MKTETKQDWTQPKEVTDRSTTRDLLPDMKDIPKEFHCFVGFGANKWANVAMDWFYDGLKNAKWTPKRNIDTKQALRHVGAVLGSWEPKHEHKMAGCAYLLSQFFDDVTYEKVTSNAHSNQR